MAYLRQQGSKKRSKSAGRTPHTKKRRYDDNQVVRKKKTMFSSRNVGHPLGITSVKHTAFTDDADIDSRVLYTKNLTDISYGEGEGKRERNIVNCRGFHIRMDWFSNLPSGSTTYYGCNVAAISPIGLASTASATDFFRYLGANNEREISFSTSLTFMEMHKLPINTDKWTVLWHERFDLLPKSSGFTPFKQSIDKYIPLNRALTFSSEGVSSCQDPVYLVYWYDIYPSTSGTLSTASAVHVQQFNVTYFREPAK